MCTCWRNAWIPAAAFAAALLTGCGGGGGGAVPTGGLLGLPTPTPAPHGAGGTPTPGPSSTPLPTPSPVATPTPSGSAPSHVMTFAFVYGYGGTPTTIPLSQMSPFVSWAFTDEQHAAALRTAGIKVAVYTNFWRNYASDNPNVGYVDLKPGGPHAAAEASTCSGTPLYDPNYGGGYLADPRSPDGLPHAQVMSNYRLGEYAPNYDALFSDDTGAWGDVGYPCNYSQSAMVTAENALHAALRVPLFVNTLGAGQDPIQQVAYEGAPNILGALCEECYSTNSGLPVTGTRWQDTETAEIETIAQHKIFWAYPRATGDASGSIPLRTYTFASFLMTYDPSLAMFEEALATPHQFPVMPETGLVPLHPVTTQSSIAGYRQSSGVYMREFADCYYRGSAIGKCAVALNADGSAESVPSQGYAHTLTISGSGILDGGSVSFGGPAITSLAAGTAAILLP
ncbi:MAG TPA: hypothetical protein VFA29_08850 [Candidatus Baltobacteraceae bacterium]|nr:hypothetical protein [Candidatus Baltobacteraceae bacterium]